MLQSNVSDSHGNINSQRREKEKSMKEIKED